MVANLVIIFFTVKKPTGIKAVFSHDLGDNLFLDLHYNEMGKLCDEITRKIIFNKNKIPK
jgi:hypothetical protein